MPRRNLGPAVEKRTKLLLKALLAFADRKLENWTHPELEAYWKIGSLTLEVRTQVHALKCLTDEYLKRLTAEDPERLAAEYNPNYKLTDDKVREALARLEDHLKILKYKCKTQGSPERRFILNMWSMDKEQNLRQFDLEWQQRRQGNAQIEETVPEEKEFVGQLLQPLQVESELGQFNPFGITGRITNPDDFFDREELLRQLFEDLSKGCNRSLVGEVQVGKSSILSMVCKWGPERLHLPSDAFIYLDMQCIHNENEFFEALCNELGIQTCRGYRLARALRGKRYILCLDEIEKMTRKEYFSGDERSELRGLADGADAPFTLVIASRSSLADLFPDKDTMTSPLANICPHLDVPPFSPNVARAFLTHRLHGTGVIFTESEISALLAESNCHPARLQRAAADLFYRYTKYSK